jgi:hypothetical protein
MKRSNRADPRPAPEETTSDEELREAGALAESIARGGCALALALKAAAHPERLDEADHEALLARALGDDAPPTKLEQRAADRLREALDGGDAQDELAELAGSLRAAWRPAPLSELQSRSLIERALSATAGRRPRRIAPVTMAALSTLAALAAGVALLLGEVGEERAPAASAPRGPAAESARRAALIPARTTASLFDPATPFPREGGQTARIDRVAAVRAADLRENRYAAWGVR